MTLDEYQIGVCKKVSTNTFWGVLTIELCSAVCKINKDWSALMDRHNDDLQPALGSFRKKIVEDLGEVLYCLARLAKESGTPLATVYKCASRTGMGKKAVANYIMRMAGTAGEFLCANDLTGKDYKNLITHYSILVMHDFINIIRALNNSSITVGKIASANMVTLTSRKE